MCKIPLKELLKDKNVVEEIQRHQWFESEKKGRDIGFDVASADWYKRFAQEWLKYHDFQASS